MVKLDTSDSNSILVNVLIIIVVIAIAYLIYYLYTNKSNKKPNVQQQEYRPKHNMNEHFQVQEVIFYPKCTAIGFSS
jgi:flagellar basal body-associated protein FliL